MRILRVSMQSRFFLTIGTYLLAQLPSPPPVLHLPRAYPYRRMNCSAMPTHVLYLHTCVDYTYIVRARLGIVASEELPRLKASHLSTLPPRLLCTVSRASPRGTHHQTMQYLADTRLSRRTRRYGFPLLHDLCSTILWRPCEHPVSKVTAYTVHISHRYAATEWAFNVADPVSAFLVGSTYIVVRWR